jgi:hypothetical protein
MTAEYAAVAEKISWFLEVVSQQREEEKTVVNAAMIQSLDAMDWTLYRTAMGTTSVITARTLVVARENENSLDLLTIFMYGSSVLEPLWLDPLASVQKQTGAKGIGN